MTREEILSTKISPEQLRALADYLKTNIPRPPRVADPTSLINNEGAMNGWINAADCVAQLAVPLDNNPVKNPDMYSEPRKTAL